MRFAVVFSCVWLMVGGAELGVPEPRVDAPLEAPEEVERSPSKRACVMSQSTLNQEQKDIILDAHDNYRKGLGANAMYKMVWDDQLAQRAQAWAEQCKWFHGFTKECNGVLNGQNLWIKPYQTPVANFDPNVPINSWYNEKPLYDYATGVCINGKMCGHYKQLVYKKSWQVGCGYANCPTVQSNPFDPVKYPSVSIFACNYRHSKGAGQLYVKGTPCSQCKGEYTCVDGLCKPVVVADCTGCRDSKLLLYCYQYLSRCNTATYSNNAKWVKKCKKTCGMYLKKINAPTHQAKYCTCPA